MKKTVLSFVFILAVAIQMNANTDPEKKESTKKQVTTEVEIPGCASDCVQDAKETALLAASDTEDISPEGELVTLYNIYYEACYYNNCIQD